MCIRDRLYVLCDIDRIGILLNEIVNTISVENKSKHKYSKDALKEPVSYTHLDVYKRQELLLVTISSDLTVTGCYC